MCCFGNAGTSKLFPEGARHVNVQSAAAQKVSAAATGHTGVAVLPSTLPTKPRGSDPCTNARNDKIHHKV